MKSGRNAVTMGLVAALTAGCATTQSKSSSFGNAHQGDIYFLYVKQGLENDDLMRRVRQGAYESARNKPYEDIGFEMIDKDLREKFSSDFAKRAEKSLGLVINELADRKGIDISIAREHVFALRDWYSDMILVDELKNDKKDESLGRVILNKSTSRLRESHLDIVEPDKKDEIERYYDGLLKRLER